MGSTQHPGQQGESGMNFNVRTENGAVIVAVEGEISIYNIGKLKDAVSSLQQKGLNRIIFDLARVEYIDSTAIKFFLTLTKELGQGEGRLGLAGANHDVLETFRITRVERFLNLHQDVPDALLAAAPTAP